MQNTLNKIIRYGLYAMAFLTPIFFLPATQFPVLANKQLLVSLLAGLLLLIWVVKIMAEGKLRFKWDKITMAVLLLLLALGVSTAFSMAQRQSFLGMAFEPDTFLSFILCGLVFLLFSNLIENKTEALRTVKAFLAGVGIAAVIFLISILSSSAFPWGFAKSVGFNPVGTVFALAILLGGALMLDVILVAAWLKDIKKCRRLTFIAEIVIGVLLLSGLVLINYWAAWTLVGLSCLLLIWIKGFSKEAVIPVCLLVLALLFVVLKVPTNRLVDLPGEVILSYQASFNVAKETALQGVKEFLLGSGPSTFGQDYDLLRTLSINNGLFWQARFTQGIAVFLTFLATGGILGLLTALLLVITFFWQGIHCHSDKKGCHSDKKGCHSEAAAEEPQPAGSFGSASASPQNDRENSPTALTTLTIFVGGFYFLLTWFFYSINFTLMFSVFLLLGLWTAVSRGRTAHFELKNMQPQHSFFIMLLCVVLIVAVVVGFYALARNYVAALAFDNAVKLIQGEEPDLDKGTELLSRAGAISRNDRYFRNLSMAFLLKAGQAQNRDMSSEDRQKVLQGLVNEIEQAAETAVKINGKDSQNWINMGDAYTELIRMGISKADELAVLSYKKAQEFSPNHPLIPFKSAIAYVLSAENIKFQIDLLQKQGKGDADLLQALNNKGQEQMDSAVEQLQKALQLKTNFTEAAQLLQQLTSE